MKTIKNVSKKPQLLPQLDSYKLEHNQYAYIQPEQKQTHLQG